MTPMSASQCQSPTRQNRRHARGTRRRRAAPPVKHGQRHDRRHHAGDAEHHHAQLQDRRGGDEAGVDVDARRQTRLRGHLQVGEDAGDLRLLFCRERAGGAGYADEVGADAAHVRPDVQCAAGAGGHGLAGRDGGHRVSERHDDGVGVGADEQAVAARLDAAWRNGREHQSTRRGQGGDRLTRDRDVEGQRRSGDQRRGDVGDQPIGAGRLRPQDGGGGLLDGQQWHQPAQQHPRDARDDGDQPGKAVSGHEARW